MIKDYLNVGESMGKISNLNQILQALFLSLFIKCLLFCTFPLVKSPAQTSIGWEPTIFNIETNTGLFRTCLTCCNELQFTSIEWGYSFFYLNIPFFWGGGGGGGEGTEGLMKRITLNTEKVEGLDKWLTERNLIWAFMEVKQIIVTSQEGDTRVCSIGVFFLQYFGNFNIQLWYWGILQTSWIPFFCILGGIKYHPSSPSQFFMPFPVFICFGNRLKLTITQSTFINKFLFIIAVLFALSETLRVAVFSITTSFDLIVVYNTSFCKIMVLA